MGDLLGMGGFCQLDYVEINTSGIGRQRAPRGVSFGGAVKHPQFYWMFVEDFLEAWPPRAAPEPWLDFRSVFVVAGARGAALVLKHRTRDGGMPCTASSRFAPNRPGQTSSSLGFWLLHLSNGDVHLFTLLLPVQTGKQILP